MHSLHRHPPGLRRTARRPRPFARRPLRLEDLEDRRLLAITIQIDYSLDTNNFFDTAAKRDLLQAAADSLTDRFADDLDAIAPSGSNSWTATFRHPGTGSSTSSSNPTIAADTILVYAGGRDLGSSLGRGGHGGYSAGGSSAWLTTVATRGESGADDASPTDYAPWGGYVTFSTTANWHFGETTTGLDSDEHDFLSVAVHELGHVLGIGTAGSWDEHISGTDFTGAASVAEYDGSGNPHVESGGGHWEEGTTDGGQEAAMDPTLTVGTRKLFTDLDWAGLEDIGWEVTPASSNIDLGIVDYTTAADINLAGTVTYELEATRSGLLTVIADFNAGGGSVEVRVYDGSSTLLTGGDTGPRHDVSVTAGSTYLIELSGTNADVDLTLANLANLSGGTLSLFGTTSADVFDFVAGGTFTATLKGIEYSYSTGSVGTIVVDLLGGSDTATVTGTSGTETAAIMPDTLTVTGSSYTINVDNAENVQVTSGGGNDTARLWGSSGNDRFWAEADTATMTPQSGSAYALQADGFRYTYAYTNGGTDTAYLFGTSGNETFVSRAAVAYVAGSSFFNHATSFRYVYGYASGGTDNAYLYGSSVDNVFVGREGTAYLSSSSYFNHVSGYTNVTGNAEGGSNNTAYLYGGAGHNNTFSGDGEDAILAGDDFSNRALGFQRNYGYASGGASNTGRLYGSDGVTNTLVGRSNTTYMVGSGYFNHISGFERVYGYAGSGSTDVAYLYGSGSSSDVYVGRPTTGYLTGNNFFNHVTNFDQIVASGEGAHATAYLFDSTGNDDLHAYQSYAILQYAASQHRVTGFAQISASSSSGGTDTTYVYDENGDPIFTQSEAEAALSNLDYVLQRTGNWLDSWS